MTIFRADRLYIEAAQSPQHCDRLLRRLKGDRTTHLVVILFIVTLAIAIIWYEASRLTRFMDQIANSPLGSKTPDDPKSLFKGDISLLVTCMLLLEIGLFLHADTCVKMLLILQQQHGVKRTSETGSPN